MKRTEIMHCMGGYTLFKNGKFYKSDIPGEYAGYAPRKIFGRLDCESGKRKMQKKNRRFFATLEDAVIEGYRPCNVCKPIGENEFEQIKHLSSEKTLKEFYSRNK